MIKIDIGGPPEEDWEYIAEQALRILHHRDRGPYILLGNGDSLYLDFIRDVGNPSTLMRVRIDDRVYQVRMYDSADIRRTLPSIVREAVTRLRVGTPLHRIAAYIDPYTRFHISTDLGDVSWI